MKCQSAINKGNPDLVDEISTPNTNNGRDNSACDFCSKVIAIYKTPFEKEAVVKLGKVSDILASSCRHAPWIRSVKYAYGPVPQYEERDLEIIKWARQTSAFLGLSYYSQSRATPTWSTTNDAELVYRNQPGHPGRAQLLDPLWIDEDLIQGWHSRCMQEHGQECDREKIEGLETVHPTWLVDVIDGCLSPLVVGDGGYITLSYTWGQVESFRTKRENLRELQEPGILLSGPISEQIPATIRDAIGVVRHLGERYLWVDSLCIVQDDEEALSRDLRRMHLIYSSSILTIVAAGGQDANYGLRGIKNLSRPRSIKPVITELADGEHLLVVNDTFEPIDLDPDPHDYHERMWIFQEYLFARRRLVFGSGPLSWQCNSVTWHEHLRPHTAADSYDVANLRYTSQFIKPQVPMLSKLGNLITDFNQKTLTYPEDVLASFSGVQSALARVFPGGLVFGHPELYFDISLVWYTVRSSAKRRRPSTRNIRNTSHNRLPSWSWMGWQGFTVLPTDSELDSRVLETTGFTESITKWYTMDSPYSTHRREIDTQWAKLRIPRPSKPPEGWACTEYEPPPHKKKRDRYKFPSLPKCLPELSYSHVSDPDMRYWYPVPVSEGKEAPKPRDQTPYLYCETSRAFLYVTPEMLVDTYTILARTALGHHVAVIKDGRGNKIGGLNLHESDASAYFDNQSLGAHRIELVAIVKGWTTQLKWYRPIEEARKEQQRPVQLEMDDSDDPDYAPTLHSDSEDEQSEECEEKDVKQDCYHVLWIEWKAGVAYRKAAGFVLADAWEKYKEAEPVKLILG
ncbi:hypothetical protein SLS62_002860 [Diatrype stigma]|uniref:Heterokaryon incompatibility domain-containing protein n=1 Tax=Diatrype stigma TaxID=117547 RepID=A0AAN9YV44_9PEZI